MKAAFLFWAATLIASNGLTAQEPEFFSEAEIFQALSWGMQESQARDIARLMTGDPAVQATIPELRDVGPVTPNYSEDFLLLLSLVSEAANRKADRYLRILQGGRELRPDERSKWEAKRNDLRMQLIQAGKLPDK